MSGPAVNCEAAAGTLRRLLDESVRCSRQGEIVILDTPYGFGNGHLLRAYVFATDEGIVVSDGGFAAKQVELFSPIPTNHNHYHGLQRVASAHDLRWDGQLSYVAPTLEDALYRLDRLALALHETEIALQQRPERPLRQAREYLRDGLRTRYGITAQLDYQVVIPRSRQPVTVDMLVQREQHRAVIEIIEARSGSAIDRQVDRSIVNFMALLRADFEGAMIGVYNEEVLNVDHWAIERFMGVKPEEVLLLPQGEALERVGELLHAA